MCSGAERAKSERTNKRNDRRRERRKRRKKEEILSIEQINNENQNGAWIFVFLDILFSMFVQRITVSIYFESIFIFSQCKCQLKIDFSDWNLCLKIFLDDLVDELFLLPSAHTRAVAKVHIKNFILFMRKFQLNSTGKPHVNGHSFSLLYAKRKRKNNFRIITTKCNHSNECHVPFHL